MIYNNEAKGLWLVPAVIVAQHDLTGFFMHVACQLPIPILRLQRFV